MLPTINKDTTLCISLSARPGNFGTRFQNFLYERLGLNFVYKAFAIQDIRGAVTGIRALGIRGCAISMPFKESCMEYLDEIDSTAQGIQSVNTIVNSNGTLRGSNTDYIAVRHLLQTSEIPVGTRFTLFGSGGMAKAVACALKEVGFNNGQIVARNERTGRSLADQYGFEWSREANEGAGLLINASPVGMTGSPEEHLMPYSELMLSQASTVFDVVAIPIETPLIRAARSKGKKVITGFEVITLQALEQFVLYTGARPDHDLVKEAALFARS